MSEHRNLRTTTAVAGALPILVILIAAFTGSMESEEPPAALFIAMGLALVAAVLAGVTATKTSRRWWPWAVGAMFTYGLPAIVLALLKPRNAAPAEDPAEVARRPVPEPVPWFVGSGIVFGLMGVLLLVVDASSSDPVTKETVSSAISTYLGVPWLVLLLVGVSKRSGKKKIQAAQHLVAES